MKCHDIFVTALSGLLPVSCPEAPSTPITQFGCTYRTMMTRHHIWHQRIQREWILRPFSVQEATFTTVPRPANNFYDHTASHLNCSTSEKWIMPFQRPGNWFLPATFHINLKCRNAINRSKPTTTWTIHRSPPKSLVHFPSSWRKNMEQWLFIWWSFHEYIRYFRWGSKIICLDHTGHNCTGLPLMSESFLQFFTNRVLLYLLYFV